MANESELSFDELVAHRGQLQSFCSSHYCSLNSFRVGISFKLTQTQDDQITLGEAKHLSSTSTCIESLLSCPLETQLGLPKNPDIREEIEKQAKQFADAAILREQEKWLSDGSAGIYCRCRTLPLVAKHLDPKDGQGDIIKEHLKKILSQLESSPSRLAIGEASEGEKEKNWYPPNAFHTYWTMLMLDRLSSINAPAYAKIRSEFQHTRFDFERLREEMLLWAHRAAGHQIALHASNSSTLDSDQLAWSLAILVTYSQDYQTSLTQQDFIRFGFQCLFERQTNIGIWRTGGPLFHYKESGNAYCYVFETFTALLKPALESKKGGFFLRQLYRSYARNLLKLWKYAESTKIPLTQSGDGKMGWISGHRPTQKHPESWATASVFSFSQCLRRLTGIWTREAAATQKLRILAAHSTAEEAIRELSERGDTWVAPEKSAANAANQLMTLFVNPTRFYSSEEVLEPDGKPIAKDQARAAILFGPPGTSKTTLSRCVAAAIGWDYVELHASHFVADGLPNVQRTADMIFEKLLQLDRTVILFDEIDELVREREKEPDAFGRFLTTSMLPKLAELWKLRKVIYFVATNHVSFFDTAITRAERFDALVHVAPPSFEKKMGEIKRLLSPHYNSIIWPELNCSQVDQALAQALGVDGEKAGADDNKKLPELNVLAKLLLMRWDQLQELASAIKDQVGDQELNLTPTIMGKALKVLSDPSLNALSHYKDYVKAQGFERHDFNKFCIWEIQKSVPEACREKLVEQSGKYWYKSRAAFGDFSDLPGCKLASPGALTFETV